MKLTDYHYCMRVVLLTLLTALIPTLGMAQDRAITGTVTDGESGDPLIGATVLIKGTTSGALTDTEGKYSVLASTGQVLVFSYAGYTSSEAVIGTGNTVDIALAPGFALDEIVVTGYTSQRKGDITGAVSVVDTDELNQIAATSFTQKLEGRASGLQVSTSGAPGAGTQIRIRGISSFNNNDPLYIIDGIPVQDNFNNAFNPNDIESIQVLKDASAASIYGSRANNGVIIITTKKGKAGRVSVNYDGYVGVQNPVGQYDLITNPSDYSEVVWRAHENAGLQVAPEVPYSFGRGQIPQYLYYGGTSGYPGSTPVDESLYSFPNFLIHQANAAGTDWWDEVFDPAPIHEHNVSISGGTQNSNFFISAGYMDQQGTMTETYFERFSLRANSSFTKGKFTFGENLSLTRTNSVGQQGGNQAEGNTMTQILKTQAIIPVRDIQGNFASGKANGLSNGSNPVARQIRGKDNDFTGYRVLGNFYGEVELLKGLKARSSFGVDYFGNFSSGFSFPSWENSEPTTINGFSENWSNGLTWTWTNQLTYSTSIGENHDISALAGYESIKGDFRNISGGFNNYFTDNINAWYLSTALADPDSRRVGSGGSFRTLVSLFGKIDYTYANKYLVSATLRRDGSSNFGDEKYGVFPAFSVGWRVSGESFMQGITWLSDLKLRFGWGITGNQDIRAGNAFSQFGGGTGSSFYAINGGNTLATGYALTSIGNPDTKWEENVSTNFGIDASLFDGSLNLVVDLYQREVDGLLFNPTNPGTQGAASPAFVNIASMQNRGVDVGINYITQVGEVGLDFGVNISHYRNEILDIDGNSESFFGSDGGRLGVNRTINQVGSPIGTFYGYAYDGIFRSQAEVEAHAAQDGKAVGRIRFKDINNDGQINGDDLGPIGSYHPDATVGLNIGATWRGFDATIFFFGSFGNEIMNYNKLFEVFRFFNTNVRKEVLTESFHPTNNPGGSLPIIDENDTFSEQPNGFYVEDGTYIRARNVQIGYSMPNAFLNRTGLSKLRIYVQAQNLFTITDYSGIDPALSNFEQGDSFGGVDEGNYPGNKIFMLGVNLGL